ncbi:MAG: hypothetical protein AAF416_10360 [Pseudomonadota bacterium]
MRRPLRILVLATLLSGCALPQNPADLARFNANIIGAADGDRTKTARVAAGVAAAQTGMSLACTMVWDGAAFSPLDLLRRYCAARGSISAAQRF